MVLGVRAAQEVCPHMLPVEAQTLDKLVVRVLGREATDTLLHTIGTGRGGGRLAGMAAVDIPPAVVPCALSATAALIAVISLFRGAIFSPITCAEALFDIVTLPSAPWQGHPPHPLGPQFPARWQCPLTLMFLLAGPEDIKS